MSMWCNWCHQGYIHPSFARFLIEKDVHLKQNLISMYKQTALNVTEVEGWRRKFPLRLDQNVGMAWFIAQTLDKCAFSFYPCAVVSLWLCTACIEMLNFSRNLETFYLDVFFFSRENAGELHVHYRLERKWAQGWQKSKGDLLPLCCHPIFASYGSFAIQITKLESTFPISRSRYIFQIY